MKHSVILSSLGWKKIDGYFHCDAAALSPRMKVKAKFGALDNPHQRTSADYARNSASSRDWPKGAEGLSQKNTKVQGFASNRYTDVVCDSLSLMREQLAQACGKFRHLEEKKIFSGPVTLWRNSSFWFVRFSLSRSSNIHGRRFYTGNPDDYCLLQRKDSCLKVFPSLTSVTVFSGRNPKIPLRMSSDFTITRGEEGWRESGTRSYKHWSRHVFLTRDKGGRL